MAILGLSYKPHTHVVEESQGIALAGLLANDYRIIIFDPVANAPAMAVLGSRACVAETAKQAVAGADVVVLTTFWPEFREIDWAADLPPTSLRTVIDPWGSVGKTVGNGVRIIRLGTGDWRAAYGAREKAA